MAKPCAKCNGTGWGRVTDEGYDWSAANEPCASCNPDGSGKPPTQSKPEPSSTVAYVDEVPQYVREGGQPTMNDMQIGAHGVPDYDSPYKAS